MAVGYLKENFAFGTLASTLNAAAVTLTMTAGHSLPTASGSFQLVIWDAATYPNPSDDPNVEIVTGSFDTGNAYDITRAQESTSDVEHAAGQKVGLHYTAAVNVDDLDASNHPMARISGSTFSTVQHAQDIFHSAGWISGGAVTDDGDGTITVALGTGLIRATDSATAQILYFDWAGEAGANVSLVDNDISYVYVEYNSGTPQVIATITQRTDFNKNVLLASVSREGTDVHINQTDQHTVGDHANSMIRRLVGTMPYGHVSGGILSETGTRNIAVTAGDFWRGLTEFTTSAVDTSGAPTFSYYYNDGSWQKVTSVSDIHQTNYNNFGVGLATLSNNKYGVHWVYIEADSDDLAVVYGIGNYTLSEAEDAQPPSAVPQHLQMEGILAGKIIIGKDDAAFTQVESAFETKFVGSIATDHADLASLDFATASHTGFQAQGDVLDDLNTLTAATVDGQMIVATGAGVFAYESGATLRTSIGVGAADVPQFAGAGFGIAIPFQQVEIYGTVNTPQLYLRANGVDEGDYSEIVFGVSSAERYSASIRAHRKAGGFGYLVFLTGQQASNVYSNLDEGMRLSEEGFLGVTCENPTAQIEVERGSTFYTTVTLSNYSDTETITSILTLRKADNVVAAPALVDDNAVLGVMNFDGHNGSAFVTGAKVEVRIDGTPSVSSMPTEYTIWTTPVGSTTPVQRMIIDPSGYFGFGLTSHQTRVEVSNKNLGTGWGDSSADTALAIVDEAAVLEIVSEDTGTWGSWINLKQVDGTVYENAWSIIRQTNGDGAGNGSLNFNYGTNVRADSNSIIATLETDGTLNTIGSYKVDGTQVVGNQAAVIADATDAASVILRFNEWLADARTHGLIAT